MLTTLTTTTTTTTNSQLSSIHQPKQASMSDTYSGHGELSATAVPFDPSGFVSVEDKQFTLFKQLQDIKNQMQQLQHQLNTVSIPTLTQMNDHILKLTPYYSSNPTYYFQVQQQQSIIFQTVQQQQQQLRILEQNRNKLQNEYQQSKHQEAPQTPINQPTDYTNTPQPIIEPIMMTPTTPGSLPMIIEDTSEIDDDDSSSESPEYQLTSSIMDTINESNEADEPKAFSVEPIQYCISDLMSFQSQFVDINWSDARYQSIDRNIRFIGTDFGPEAFMKDVLAMISRRCTERFSDRVASCDVKESQMKKLKGILNKMTPEKFSKIAAETMVIISDYAQSKEELLDVLLLILSFGTEQSMFSEQYAQLIQHLFDYLPRLVIKCDYEWITNDDCLSKTFRKMVIISSHSLFCQYRNHSVIDIDINKQKKTFISFLKLCGDLYNVEMMKSGVIYKGIIDELLPPKNKNISSIDIEGICTLFKQCGDKLDEENTNRVDVYLDKIKELSNGFDFRTQCLVDGIKEMRLKDWTHRIKKEKPKELDEVKKEFDQEQENKNLKQKKTYVEREENGSDYRGYREDDRYYGHRRRSRSHYDDGRKTYYDDGYYLQKRRCYGYYESGYDERYYQSYNSRSRYDGYHSNRHRSYGNY